MPSRRVQKAAEAVREVVSWAILTELNDPRVRDVTVTYVEMSGDLRQAKVYVSIMGDDTKQNLSLQGLRHAAGFLQSRLADRIDSRYTPRIEFVLDLGVKRSIEVSRILKEVLPKPEPQPDDLDDFDDLDDLDDTGELEESELEESEDLDGPNPADEVGPEVNLAGEPPGPEAREPTS
ncbi:MAG: 30S ribosome-binding factor RbfA [Planctomycetia bacterium]|nr:30S ribosome-binding factor RbfA [Planctomycetia bacterium]